MELLWILVGFPILILVLPTAVRCCPWFPLEFLTRSNECSQASDSSWVIGFSRDLNLHTREMFWLIPRLRALESKFSLSQARWLFKDYCLPLFRFSATLLQHVPKRSPPQMDHQCCCCSGTRRKHCPRCTCCISVAEISSLHRGLLRCERVSSRSSRPMPRSRQEDRKTASLSNRFGWDLWN